MATKKKFKSKKTAKRGSKKAGKRKVKKVAKRRTKKLPSKSRMVKSKPVAAVSKPAPVDFDDEDAVLRQVAERLEEDMDGLQIEDVSSRTFTGVTAYEITGASPDPKYSSRQPREYMVYRDDDEAEAEAIARVKQDLEESPENFESNFIESHIDMKKLKDVVYDSNMEDDMVEDIARRDTERFWEDYAREFDAEEYETTDEDGDTVLPDDVPDEAVEKLKEHYATERAKDPMEYFRDIYGNEAAKYAIQAAGLDIDAAAEEAVRVDGWPHFMNTYSGDYILTNSDFVVFRTHGRGRLRDSSCDKGHRLSRR